MVSPDEAQAGAPAAPAMYIELEPRQPSSERAAEALHGLAAAASASPYAYGAHVLAAVASRAVWAAYGSRLDLVRPAVRCAVLALAGPHSPSCPDGVADALIEFAARCAEDGADYRAVYEEVMEHVRLASDGRMVLGNGFVSFGI